METNKLTRLKILSNPVEVKHKADTAYYRLFDVCKSMGIEPSNSIKLKYMTKSEILSYLISRHGKVNTVSQYEPTLSRMLDGKPNNRGSFSKRDAIYSGYTTESVSVIYTEKCKLRYHFKYNSEELWISMIDLSRNFNINHGLIRKAIIRSKNFNLKEIPVKCNDGLYHVTTCIHIDELDKFLRFINAVVLRRGADYTFMLQRGVRERYISAAKKEVIDSWKKLPKYKELSSYDIVDASNYIPTCSYRCTNIKNTMRYNNTSWINSHTSNTTKKYLDDSNTLDDVFEVNFSNVLKSLISIKSNIKALNEEKNIIERKINELKKIKDIPTMDAGELRHKINVLIKEGVTTGEEVTDRWHQLYAEMSVMVGFSFKDVFNIVTKATDKRFKFKLDVVEKLGYLDLMYETAKILFSKQIIS